MNKIERKIVELEERDKAEMVAQGIYDHWKTGWGCLVYHNDKSKGKACFKCGCGEYVRPHEWEEHITI